jgi:rare lipoprotein A
MTRKLFSSLTATASILVLGVVPSSLAEEIRRHAASEEHSQDHRRSDVPALHKRPKTSPEVVKVGEYQACTATDTSCRADDASEAIASLYAHEWQGRQAATLYVKDIPVLLFLGASAENTSAAESQVGAMSEVAVSRAGEPTPSSVAGSKKPASAAKPANDPSDPVWRASAIAAQLNQMHRQNVDAESIRGRWHPELESYVIEVNGEILVELSDSVTFVSDTDNLARNTLETTNKLRRLLGEAPPLASIPTKPQPQPQPERNNLLASLRGYASWYGPGFHGRLSASGEPFNQYDLTAAHRSLPFGTRVRVTNLRNGSSVVVRINDRGPYHGNRIIDLSKAAAQVLGLTRMGVAPVRVEVLGRPR